MQVIGKLILFVEEKTTKNGESFKTYSTSVGHKNEDGTYVNATLEVRFAKDSTITQEQLSKLDSKKCYTLEVKNSWIDVRSFTRKDNSEGRAFVIVVKDAKCESAKDIVRKDIRDQAYYNNPKHKGTQPLPDDLPF